MSNYSSFSNSDDKPSSQAANNKSQENEVQGLEYLAMLLESERQHQQEKLEEIEKTGDLDSLKDLEEPLSRLQNLLSISPLESKSINQIEQLSKRVRYLEAKIYQIGELIYLMLPLIAQESKPSQAKLKIIKSLQQQIISGIQVEYPNLITGESELKEPGVEEVKAQINILEKQIDQQQNYVRKLLPLLENKKDWEQEKLEIVQTASQKITEKIKTYIWQDRDLIIQVVAPLIDKIVEENKQQDINLMSHAMAPILPPAISEQVRDYPDEIAHAIAPEMATAIAEQIKLEREAMVDALYPIMGSSISKAISQTINEINEKVDNSLSFEGVSRKIRARVQGVSEAELLLTEAAFRVRAIFLIQKDSGLVISSFQETGEHELESEMIAGMLTAIRSFVSEYIANTEDVSEIDAINYGNSEIILEVAGHCYLAIVVDGKPSKQYWQKMHHILSQILQNYSEVIEVYDGEARQIPESLHQLVAKLQENNVKLEPKRFPTLAILGLICLILIIVPLSLFQYRNWSDHNLTKKINHTLATIPQLSAYDLEVKVWRENMKLSGIVMHTEHRQQAEIISQKLAPYTSVDNKIIALEALVNPAYLIDKLEKIASRFNEQTGTEIQVNYSSGKITLTGRVDNRSDLTIISHTFKQVPMVTNVINHLEWHPLVLKNRIYFSSDSTIIPAPDKEEKLAAITQFLQQYPDTKIEIVGYSDPETESGDNLKLAQQRAIAVQKFLTSGKIASARLNTSTRLSRPPEVEQSQSKWLSRCVIFKLVRNE